MCKKLIFLTLTVTLLLISSNATATLRYWSDGGSGHSWTTADNWYSFVENSVDENNPNGIGGDAGVPVAGDTARVGKGHPHTDYPPELAVGWQSRIDPTVSSSATCKHVYCGGAISESSSTDDPNLNHQMWITTGGDLNVTNEFILCLGSGGSGTINMDGGNLDVGMDFSVGYWGGTATINLSGGTIDCGGIFYCPRNTYGCTATVNITGGKLELDELEMVVGGTSTGEINVAGGELVLDGDQRNLVYGYMYEPNQWIKTYGVVHGSVISGSTIGVLNVDYGVTHTGKTTVTASQVTSALRYWSDDDACNHDWDDADNWYKFQENSVDENNPNGIGGDAGIPKFCDTARIGKGHPHHDYPPELAVDWQTRIDPTVDSWAECQHLYCGGAESELESTDDPNLNHQVWVTTGGHLAVANEFYLALGHERDGNENTGTVNMDDGELTVGGNLMVGSWGGTATINLTGGNIDVGGTLYCPHNIYSCTSKINLDGGTIQANDFNMVIGYYSTGEVNITNGELVLDGDRRELVYEYMHKPNYWIRPYDANYKGYPTALPDGNFAALSVDYNSTIDKTTVTAYESASNSGYAHYWSDDGADHLWNTPENWLEVNSADDTNRGSSVPKIWTVTRVGQGGMNYDYPAYLMTNWTTRIDPTIDGYAECVDLSVGTCTASGGVAQDPNSHHQLWVATGGNLYVQGSMNLGCNPNGLGTLHIDSGAEIVVDNDFSMGYYGGDGTVNVNGGSLKCKTLKCPAGPIDGGGVPSGSGTINIYSGTVEADDLYVHAATGTGDADCLINIEEGQLILEGNDIAIVTPLIADGNITGYGVVDGGITADHKRVSIDVDLAIVNPHATTVSASYIDSRKAWNPSPRDDSMDIVEDDAVLTWSSGEDAVYHMIYFGTSYSDVNTAGTGDSEYKGIQGPNSYDPTITDGTTYYWRIDEMDGNSTVIKGDVWTFWVFDSSSFPAWCPNGYGVWIADSMGRVFPDSRPGGDVNNCDSDPNVTLKMAKREYEAFQLVILPAPGRTLENVTLEISNLTSGGNIIDGNDIDYYQVGYVYLTDAYVADKADYIDDGAPNNGWYPDILLPVDSFEVNDPNRAQPVWISVYTDTTTVAGDYTGTITLKTDSGYDTTIDVNVTVFDFTLPLGPAHCVTGLVVRTNDYNYTDYMLEHRLNADNLWRDTPPSVEDINHYHSLGQNYYTIADVEYCTNDVLINNFLNDINSTFAPAKAQIIRDMGSFFGFDEDYQSGWSAMRTRFQTCESNWPDIERVTTAKIFEFWGDDPCGAMEANYIDEIVPLTIWYDYNDGEVLRANGYKQWGYTCNHPNPDTPYVDDPCRYANIFIHYPLVECRLIPWQMYQQKMDGFFYYDIRNWVDSTPLYPIAGPLYNFELGTMWPWGDGVMMYPGVDGPIGCLRLESFSDGVEEYEYLYRLADRANDIEVAREYCNDVVWGMHEQPVAFTHDHDTIKSVRETIGQILGSTKATAYSPVDGANEVAVDTTLRWIAGRDAVTHKVYFGNRPWDLNYKGEIDERSWTPPSDLIDGMTYYWRIDDVNGASTITGDVWSFTTVLDPNLIAWWKFDENTGSTAYDSSKNSNNLTLVSTSWDSNGFDDCNCLHFPYGGYTDVPNSLFSAIDEEVTVSVWIYGDEGFHTGRNWDFIFQFGWNDPYDGVISLRMPRYQTVEHDYGEFFPMRFDCGRDETYFDFVYWDEGTDQNEWKGAWTHFAVTKTTDTNTARIYRNGVLEAEKTTCAKDMDGIVKATIGACCYGHGDSIAALMNDFRIYNRDLDTNEVNAIYEEKNQW